MYKFWAEVNVKSKFWGQSLDIHPLGTGNVSLPLYESPNANTEEHFSWKKVVTSVNIVGKLSIDHYGDMVIKNHRTNETCTITFKLKESGGWFTSSNSIDGNFGAVTGKVLDSQGLQTFDISGSWTHSLRANSLIHSKGPIKSVLLWVKNPMPDNSRDNFNFTSFALTLNQLNASLSTRIPLTDARRRPDQRCMEKGEWDHADKLKEGLEARQRASRKTLVSEFNNSHVAFGPPLKGIPFGEEWWTARWFNRMSDSETGEDYWKFNHEYWRIRNEASENRQAWPNYVTDIFGVANEY